MKTLSPNCSERALSIIDLVLLLGAMSVISAVCVDRLLLTGDLSPWARIGTRAAAVEAVSKHLAIENIPTAPVELRVEFPTPRRTILLETVSNYPEAPASDAAGECGENFAALDPVVSEELLTSVAGSVDDWYRRIFDSQLPGGAAATGEMPANLQEAVARLEKELIPTAGSVLGESNRAAKSASVSPADRTDAISSNVRAVPALHARSSAPVCFARNTSVVASSKFHMARRPVANLARAAAHTPVQVHRNTAPKQADDYLPAWRLRHGSRMPSVLNPAAKHSL